MADGTGGKATICCRYARACIASLLISIWFMPVVGAGVAAPLNREEQAAQSVALAGIASTMSRYCYATDNADAAMLLDTFTPDAVLVATIASGTSQAVPELKGAKAIVDFVMNGRKESSDVRRHFVTNYWLEKFQSNVAIVHMYFLIVVTSPDGHAQTKATGRYRNEMLLGADGIWRIRHETVMLDGPY